MQGVRAREAMPGRAPPRNHAPRPHHAAGAPPGPPPVCTILSFHSRRMILSVHHDRTMKASPRSRCCARDDTRPYTSRRSRALSIPSPATAKASPTSIPITAASAAATTSHEVPRGSLTESTPWSASFLSLCFSAPTAPPSTFSAPCGWDEVLAVLRWLTRGV